MTGHLPICLQNLAMGSPRPVAVGVNFVKQTFSLNGVSTPAVAAYTPASAASVASISGGTVVDKFAVDLAVAGYTRNGAFFLALAASTPVTVDLTNTPGAAPATAGDTFFGSVKDLIFNNSGTSDVTVSPGASHGFSGPLAGSSPTFVVPAGSRHRWNNPAGWPVTAIVKNLKFDPGSSPGSIAVSVGGGF